MEEYLACTSSRNSSTNKVTSHQNLHVRFERSRLPETFFIPARFVTCTMASQVLVVCWSAIASRELAPDCSAKNEYKLNTCETRQSAHRHELHVHIVDSRSKKSTCQPLRAEECTPRSTSWPAPPERFHQQTPPVFGNELPEQSLARKAHKVI